MNQHTPRTPEPLVSVDTNGRGLQCRFVWQGDRFAHVIETLDPEVDVRPSWQYASVESGSDEPWPGSPPTQQLSLEHIGNSLAVLGVGASGSGHWSVSILASHVDGRPALIFDQAVRSMTQPENCGSLYEQRGDAIAIETPSLAVPTAVDRPSGTVVRVRPQTLPPWDNPSPRGETTRWSYAMILRDR